MIRHSCPTSEGPQNTSCMPMISALPRGGLPESRSLEKRRTPVPGSRGLPSRLRRPPGPRAEAGAESGTGPAAESACAQVSAVITLGAPGYFCLQQEDGCGQSPEIAEAVSGELLRAWSLREDQGLARPTSAPSLGQGGRASFPQALAWLCRATSFGGPPPRVLWDPAAPSGLRGSRRAGVLGAGGHVTPLPAAPRLHQDHRVQGLESRSTDGVKPGSSPLSSRSWAESQPVGESVFSAVRSMA